MTHISAELSSRLPLNESRIRLFVVVLHLAIACWTLSWFEGKDFISFGTFAFPLSGKTFFDNTRFLWDSDLDTGYADARQIAFLLLALGARCFDGIGLDISTFEKFLFVFWAYIALAGSYLLCRFIGLGRVGAFSGSLFYAINFYSMSVVWHISHGQLIPAYSFLPLFFWLFLQAAESHYALKKSILFILISTLLGTYAFANPALAVVCWSVPIAFVAFQSFSLSKVENVKCWRRFIMVLFGYCLLNSFFLFPLVWELADVYAKSAHGLRFAADRIIYAQNSSPLSNLFELRGMWDIGGKYSSGAPYRTWDQDFSGLFFRVPNIVIVVLSVIFFSCSRGKTKVYLTYFASLLIFALFLQKGPNPPFGMINEALFSESTHLLRPFRSNITKTGMLGVLALTPLFGFAISQVCKQIRNKLGLVAQTMFFVLLLTVFAQLSLPYWTGDIIFRGDNNTPGARFTLPDDYNELKKWVEIEKTRGRVLILPMGRTSNVKLFWDSNDPTKQNGYIGGEFLRWQLDGGIIHYPGGALSSKLYINYFSPENNQPKDSKFLLSLLRAGNIRYILHRGDSTHLSQDKAAKHIASLEEYLGEDLLYKVFGKLKVYRIPDNVFLGKVFIP